MEEGFWHLHLFIWWGEKKNLNRQVIIPCLSESLNRYFLLTSLLRHISKSSISVVSEQEVGSVLVVAKHIGVALAHDGPHDHTSASCAVIISRDEYETNSSSETLMSPNVLTDVCRFKMYSRAEPYFPVTLVRWLPCHFDTQLPWLAPPENSVMKKAISCAVYHSQLFWHSSRQPAFDDILLACL